VSCIICGSHYTDAEDSSRPGRYAVSLRKSALKMNALRLFIKRELFPHRQQLTSQKTWTFKTV